MLRGVQSVLGIHTGTLHACSCLQMGQHRQRRCGASFDAQQVCVTGIFFLPPCFHLNPQTLQLLCSSCASICLARLQAGRQGHGCGSGSLPEICLLSCFIFSYFLFRGRECTLDLSPTTKHQFIGGCKASGAVEGRLGCWLWWHS